MKMKKTLSVFLFLLISQSSFALTATEIMDKADANRSYPASKQTSSMSIQDSFGIKNMKAVMHARGKVDTLIEMLTGESKGQKILRTENEVYIFYPDAGQVIRLKGAGLRQSMFGSDISYEDLTSTKKTTENFDIALQGKEKIGKFMAYKLHLEEKQGVKGQAYPIQTVWVDTLTFLPVQAEYYSKSNRLLKIMHITSYKKVGNFYVATDMDFKDVLKKNTLTRMHVDTIDLNTPITDKTFSLENLRW